jgi:methylmalonyl-CoA mutase
LNQLRANRDEAAVKAALEAITMWPVPETVTLLELAVEAARVRASLGEYIRCLRKLWQVVI